MKKTELKQKTEACFLTTKDALQLVYDNLNQGQQKKILKEEAVKNLLVFYGIVEE